MLDSAALVERLKLLQEESSALITGLFGMNVGGIPLAQAGYGFFLIVGTLAACTALVGTWVFGRRRE